jgi:antitoxin component YwqK of YwqJK toxin-antitoxin module
MGSSHTKDGKETKDKEQAHYSRELSILENSQVHVIEKYIESNKTKLVGTFPNIQDKKFIGQKLEAFENGKIKTKEFYSKDGVLIDTAYYYYPNGKLKLAFEYPYTVEKETTKVTDTLILVYHDSLGKRHLHNGNGYAEIDVRNSGIEKGNYENHKRIGKWTGSFMRDKYSFEETYDNGKLISGITKDSLTKEYI